MKIMINKKIITLVLVCMAMLLSCSINKINIARIDNPEFLIGEWVFVKMKNPVGSRYSKTQNQKIFSTSLIISKDSIYFKKNIDFIENCGNFQWSFSKVDEFSRDETRRLINENIDSLILINSNCYEDIKPTFLKEDTLISFNGGIITYRVKVATTGH